VIDGKFQVRVVEPSRGDQEDDEEEERRQIRWARDDDIG